MLELPPGLLILDLDQTLIFSSEHELEHSNSSGLENAVRFVDFEEIGERIYTKPLAKIRKLAFNLERVIAVNDVAENYHDAYGNLVQVRKYLGDSSDTELLRLGQYLPRLASESNIRKLEQRH